MVLISIHAPLTGSDHWAGFWSQIISDFNPRSPYGERPSRGGDCAILTLFQSTLPLRGATDDYCAGKGVQDISIHAPLTGSDWKGRGC